MNEQIESLIPGIIAETRREMYRRTVGLTFEESEKLKTWIDATLALVEEKAGAL